MGISKYYFALLLIVFLSGCTTLSKQPHFYSNAGFITEEQKLWTRPTEVGYTVGKTVLAKAEVTTVFGIVVEGESPKVAVAGFIGSEDPLIKTATYNAIIANKADGIYVTRSKIERTGLWPFYTKKEASICGKVLFLKTIGQVDKERYDKERALIIEGQSFKKIEGGFTFSK